MPVQNLISLWSSLSIHRRIIVAGATIAMFLAIFALSRMATTPGMALLYAGLDSSAAGEVVRALDQRGVAYQISGDTIRVDASQRDALRMTLAAEGLPATGAAGYELLDGLSGFGTTSQMFDAAYWRAKEGELARTIVATPAIRAARVHIAQSPTQPFQRDTRPTASVTITSASGALPAAQANAVRHLVAAAVAGMQPEDVSVIDSVAGFIPADAAAALPVAGGDARAADLKRNIERLLFARVGQGKAIVEVSVDVETDREQITEKRFDPQGRVAISSDTEERNNSATQPNDDVTVASNLPEGDAAAGGQGKSNSSETRERVNYEVSETQREVLKVPGALRRVSVAVLVDGEQVTAADGVVSWQPRAEDELAVLRELVTSAAGLDLTRGDVLVLKSLAFEPVGQAGSIAESGMFSTFGPIDLMALIQAAVLALVALILGVFVVRPLLAAAPKISHMAGEPGPLALPPGATGSATARGAQPRIVTGEIDDHDLPDLPVISVDDDERGLSDPMARLRRLIDERQSETVEILRGWMETDEEEQA
ncbi:flagellar basal-body MS-ring/collar protein FliF [Pseudorhodobacter sp.]|uniref:flagellar basal-body MS-ring/collar protein FliF n=1 Tax=Pseudorhodobacter sp. TaxID=1934400 RepID=UPI0026488B03|nr:flagellar basal-body MS-ring/collar protein FliF [Pseudorhodobacter sp.]MDN5786671.1 flagellar M-ring protein FliF [Pseudorhodobacter sp.]